MKRIMMIGLLISGLALAAGCSSAQGQCPGGNCSRGWGVWSPWVGGYYWQSPCAGGKCQRPKLDEKTAPEEPENPSIEPECPEPDENAAAEPAEPAAEEEVIVAETVFKPFCVRVAELVNAQRAALGLPPLKLDAVMCEGCDRHSAWMTGGGGFQHGYYAGARECIAKGVNTPEAVVSMWLNSSGHRAIILGGGTVLGVGFSGNFWTLRVR